MSEHIYGGVPIEHGAAKGETRLERREEIVRCRDCKWFNMPDWDNTLAMLYGEPPTTCDLLSHNEWRMDGDRRVAETTFLEVEPEDFCSFGKRKVDA